MTFRRMLYSDVEEFLMLRMKQVEEEGSNLDEYSLKKTRNYITNGLNNGTFFAWVAVDENIIVATGGLTIVNVVPFGVKSEGKIGILSCMYCEPLYRRKGIAHCLLEHIVEEARAQLCDSIQITGSDLGVLLYDSFGFYKNNNFRQLKL